MDKVQAAFYTAIYANDVIFNTFCMYVAYLASKSSAADASILQWLLGGNWYLTLWFVIYYVCTTEDVRDPRDNQPMAETLRRFFPCWVTVGLLAVPVGILAVPIKIVYIIQEARKKGTGLISHSCFSALCALMSAILIVYAAMGIVTLCALTATLALSFSSFTLALYSMFRYASSTLFLCENVFRFFVSLGFAVPSLLLWLPSDEQENWWVIAVALLGLAELPCIYYRYNHIPPEVKFDDIEEIELAVIHSFHGPHNPFSPTRMISMHADDD